MAACRRVYNSRHLQADCQEPGSAPEPYARKSSMGYPQCREIVGLPLLFLEIYNPAAGYANRFLGISESGYGSSATPRPSGGPANSLMTVAPVHQTCTRRRQLEGIADRRTRLPDDDAAISAETPQQMAV